MAKAVLLSRGERARAHLTDDGTATTLCNRPIPERRKRHEWDGTDTLPTGRWSSIGICRTCKAKATGEKKTSPRFTKAAAKALHARAWEAAAKAADAAIPAPMMVYTPRDPVASLLGQDDGGVDPNEPIYRVNEGACGMAWVTIHPGNCSFARHLKLRASYYGGAEVYRPGFNGQSLERGQAAARAYADVLNEAGITAYSHSRMD
jgi:hypothetical protein